MRQKLTKLNGEVDKFTIIVGALNTSLSVIDISNKQEINNNIVEWNSTTNQLDVTNLDEVDQFLGQNLYKAK